MSETQQGRCSGLRKDREEDTIKQLDLENVGGLFIFYTILIFGVALPKHLWDLGTCGTSKQGIAAYRESHSREASKRRSRTYQESSEHGPPTIDPVMDVGFIDYQDPVLSPKGAKRALSPFLSVAAEAQDSHIQGVVAEIQYYDEKGSPRSSGTPSGVGRDGREQQPTAEPAGSVAVGPNDKRGRNSEHEEGRTAAGSGTASGREGEDREQEPTPAKIIAESKTTTNTSRPEALLVDDERVSGEVVCVVCCVLRVACCCCVLCVLCVLCVVCCVVCCVLCVVWMCGCGCVDVWMCGCGKHKTENLKECDGCCLWCGLRVWCADLCQ